MLQVQPQAQMLSPTMCLGHKFKYQNVFEAQNLTIYMIYAIMQMNIESYGKKMLLLEIKIFMKIQLYLV